MPKKRKSRSTMETCFKILQLKFDKKLTNRCIGLTLHISASTVFEVLARFKASSLSWPLPADISHDTLEKLIFPPQDTSASELVMPDMLYFDTEMRKPGVTRQLLWMEYKAQAGDKAMGYSHFCRCYRKWKKRDASPCDRSIVLAKSSLSTSVVLRSLLLIWTPERYAAWQSSWL